MLVLQDADNIERAPVPFQLVKDRCCCKAHYYHAALPWLHEQAIRDAFHMEIGVYYNGKKCVRPLTVTTYDAAGELIAEHGNSFAMVICDETQHMPIQTWGEALCMAPAPFRLGLTGTSPKEHEQRGE